MTSTLENRFLKTEFSGFRLEKTVKLMKLTLSRLFNQHPELDTTVDQWVIMYLLNKKGSMTQHDIAEQALKDAPTVTRMMDLMESKGLVIREQDPLDKRRLLVQLTSNGLEKFEKMQAIVTSFRAEAYKGIDESQVIQLDNTLNKIFNNLTKFH